MHKPTQEDEYFAREDAEKLRKIAAQQRALLADDEKRSLREQHHLHCPSCGMKMGEVSYSGMKIGRCFGCNGTFLSGGDLEKIAHVDSGHVMNDILRLFEHKKSL
jgi:ribosomal protein L37AE/L43A